jgi:hypothetical protein
MILCSTCHILFALCDSTTSHVTFPGSRAPRQVRFVPRMCLEAHRIQVVHAHESMTYASPFYLHFRVSTHATPTLREISTPILGS